MLATSRQVFSITVHYVTFSLDALSLAHLVNLDVANELSWMNSLSTLTVAVIRPSFVFDERSTNEVMIVL